jgi:hypothetical protein
MMQLRHHKLDESIENFTRLSGVENDHFSFKRRHMRAAKTNELYTWPQGVCRVLVYFGYPPPPPTVVRNSSEKGAIIILAIFFHPK